MHKSDFLVVGAGGMGSAAGYHLAKRGCQPWVLEQFVIDHGRGSSQDESRVIRYAYDEPDYIELMMAAYQHWDELAEEAGRTIVHRCGCVSICPADNAYVSNCAAGLARFGIAHEIIDAVELGSRFPQFRPAPDDQVLFTGQDGFLSPSQCVRHQVDLARRHGATILENTPVRRLDLSGRHPVVVTDHDRYECDRLVVTAGAWTRRLLQDLDLPLVVTRQQVVWFQPRELEMFRPGRFPVFVEVTDEFLYGFPVCGIEGVKVARHGKGQAVDPDHVNRDLDDDYAAFMRQWLQRLVPDAAGPILHGKVCLYTETPDTDFIIDRHPRCGNVIIGAGFTGHGFKFANLVGRLLADLATDAPLQWPIDRFATARFAGKDFSGFTGSRRFH